MASRSGTKASSTDGAWRNALLKATHRVADTLGGNVALPLLGMDPEILEIGQQQVAAAGGGRISLKQLLEDACLGAPRAARVVVRELPSDPFPMVCTNFEASGRHASPVRRQRSEVSNSSSKRIRLERSAGKGGGSSSGGRPNGKASTVKLNGVEVYLLSGNIPVVTLDGGSVFDLNASWLLQNSCGLYQKAGSLYEDCPPRSPQYKKIIGECLERGLAASDQELWVVRLTKKPECVAVGTCGKRSVMMALVVGAAICEGGQPIPPGDLEEMDLRRPYERLMAVIRRMME